MGCITFLCPAVRLPRVRHVPRLGGVRARVLSTGLLQLQLTLPLHIYPITLLTQALTRSTLKLHLEGRQHDLAQNVMTIKPESLLVLLYKEPL